MKAVNIIGFLITVSSFLFQVSSGPPILSAIPGLPPITGISRLNVVIHLAILTAIGYGFLWWFAELAFG